MFNLPLYVGIDYPQKTIHVCVIDQHRKILANKTVKNDPYAVLQVVAHSQKELLLCELRAFVRKCTLFEKTCTRAFVWVLPLLDSISATVNVTSSIPCFSERNNLSSTKRITKSTLFTFSSS